jgi:flavodoxin
MTGERALRAGRHRVVKGPLQPGKRSFSLTEKRINDKTSSASGAVAVRPYSFHSGYQQGRRRGMKVLVTYYTQTGNTEKVARAIYDSLTMDRMVLPAAEVKTPVGYDLVFCGFPVQAHSVPGKMAEFIKGLPKGQKVAFFATYGSLRGGQLPRQAFESAAGLAINLKVLGQFGCQGKVDAKIIDALMKKPEHRAWAEEAQSAEGHPDAADLKDARVFAQEMVDRAIG